MITTVTLFILAIYSVVNTIMVNKLTDKVIELENTVNANRTVIRRLVANEEEKEIRNVES